MRDAALSPGSWDEDMVEYCIKFKESVETTNEENAEKIKVSQKLKDDDINNAIQAATDVSMLVQGSQSIMSAPGLIGTRQHVITLGCQIGASNKRFHLPHCKQVLCGLGPRLWGLTRCDSEFETLGSILKTRNGLR